MIRKMRSHEGGGIQIDLNFLHNNNTALIKKNIPVSYCLSDDKDLKFQL